MIVWMESFDTYGTTTGGRPNMLLGLWSTFGYGTSVFPHITNEQARTGEFSLKFENNALANGASGARRGLGDEYLVIGHGQGIFFESLPGGSGKLGWQIRDTGNNDIASVSVGSDGSISAYAGDTDGTLLGSSDPGIISTGAWEHVEIKWFIDNVVGSIEVRVNGEATLLCENADLGVDPTTQLSFGGIKNDSGSTCNFHMDDIIVWDTTGSFNNDFLGPVRVATVFPGSDEAAADWLAFGEATGWECLDDPEQDGDTTYIYSVTAGDISEFGLGTIPAETHSIAGVYIPTLAKLAAPGTGNVQVSMVSNGDAQAGADVALTTSYNYTADVFEVDPDTGVAWTKTGLQAAIIHIEKTV